MIFGEMKCFVFVSLFFLLTDCNTKLKNNLYCCILLILFSMTSCFEWINDVFVCLFNKLIYFWLCWVFVSVRGLSPVAASGGHSSSRCAGLSLSWPLLLRSTGSRHAGSVAVAHGLSRSAACGIFPDQGSNPFPCIGRQSLNHCATREAPMTYFILANKKKN